MVCQLMNQASPIPSKMLIWYPILPTLVMEQLAAVELPRLMYMPCATATWPH